MNTFVLTPAAIEDIEALWQYIARDSVEQANLVEEAVFSTCRLAADMPQIGHRRADIASAGVLFLPVTSYKRYSIAYRLGTEPLSIVRVIHGARNVPKMFRARS